MILNFYIDTGSDNSVVAAVRALKVLVNEGFTCYDATDFDSLTSGPCKVTSLSEVKHEIEDI